MTVRVYSSHDGRELGVGRWVCGATSSGDVLVGRVGEADRGGFVVVTWCWLVETAKSVSAFHIDLSTIRRVTHPPREESSGGLVDLALDHTEWWFFFREGMRALGERYDDA